MTVLQGRLLQRVNPNGWSLKESKEDSFNSQFKEVYEMLMIKFKEYVI